jgi:hypothetical protein
MRGPYTVAVACNSVECVRAGPDVISMKLLLAMDVSKSESSEFCLLCMGLELGIPVCLASLDKVFVQPCSIVREVFNGLELGDVEWVRVTVR